MKILKFTYKNKTAWGIKNKNLINIIDEPWGKMKISKKTLPISEVKILAPVLPTSKIILVGLNYVDHAQELNLPLPTNPIIFLKPITSIQNPYDPIILPIQSKRVDYEAELAVVIAKEGKNIPEKEVFKYILGYTCLNDVTARDIQKKDGQWTRAKAFDTFCPVGPWIETKVNCKRLKIYTKVNGEYRQYSSTENLIFSVSFIVSFISSVMTLYPGDIISTGTPPGVGPIISGDKVEVGIEKIGRLINPVK